MSATPASCTRARVGQCRTPHTSEIPPALEGLWVDAVRHHHPWQTRKLKSGPKDMTHRLKNGPKGISLIPLKEKELRIESNHMASNPVNHIYRIKPQ